MRLRNPQRVSLTPLPAPRLPRPRLRPLREEATRIENLVDELEREKSGLAAELADPDTYAGASGCDLAARQRRWAEVERELGAALEGWEEVHARIAAAEGEAELGASDDGD